MERFARPVADKVMAGTSNSGSREYVRKETFSGPDSRIRISVLNSDSCKAWIVNRKVVTDADGTKRLRVFVACRNGCQSQTEWNRSSHR